MAVTLKQIKDYLRIDEDLTEDDELIGSLIEAATDYLEQTTGKSIVITASFLSWLLKCW